MPRYRVYAHIHAGKFIGEFEANSPDEAVRLGEESDNCFVSVCHQCAGDVDDPQVGDLEAELIDE